MITRVSGVTRPKGSDLIFDHPYIADYECVAMVSAVLRVRAPMLPLYVHGFAGLTSLIAA